ncbi:MAG TPA: ribonuclease H-like YkuK family protein [Clostridiales bacterium]|nr:ribonuclease H-like YkuK family protein [Clostridiales bacterium]
MILGNALEFDENTVFRSIRKDNMTISDVYDEILNFIRSDTECSYKISIGTDSQSGTGTVFVSCILVHRVGRGAIGFLHKAQIPRPIKSLREKIYLETCASLQLAYLFDDDKIQNIINTVKSGDKSRGVSFEFHIDIGTKGPTKALISEMTGMVKGLSFVPKIKPDSYCASSFADKYTKAM